MLQTQDLLTDADILALDHAALTTFGNTPSVVSANLATKRHLAIHSWLYGRMVKAGYQPHKHLVRYAPASAFSLISGSYADITEAVSDTTADDVTLSTILATPATDALFLASPEPVRGLFVGLHDSPNAIPNTLTVSYWSGSKWVAISSLTDPTQATSGVSFSGGGMLSWPVPEDWQRRPLSTDTEYRYWLRLTMGSTLTVPTKATHLLPVRHSRLTYPAALYTLSLMYAESWGVQRGEWDRKAREYREAAEAELALALLGLTEFDTTGDQVVSLGTEVARPDPSLFEFERG